MIPLKLFLAVILNIWTIGHATSCGDQQTLISGKCCDMCRPGEYLKDFCSKDLKTVCSPCEEGSYSDKFSMFDRCKKCQSCQQEYDEKCTLTTNAKCSCRSGFLCSNSVCSTCEENICAIWEKLKKTDIPSGEMTKYSYQCEPACPDNNTYFDVKEKNCKRFTQCNDFGFNELFRGNKTHNSVCDTNANNGGISLTGILCIGFVLLSPTFLVFLCYASIKSLRKHKANMNPTAVETSNYHLPTEESGLQYRKVTIV